MEYRPRMPRRYDCPYDVDPWDYRRDTSHRPRMDDDCMMMVRRHTQLLQDIQRTTQSTYRLTRDIHRWVGDMHEDNMR